MDDSELSSLASQLESKVGDSTRMRYPDRVHYPEIPNDVYANDTAQKVLELASTVLEKVSGKLSKL